MKDLKKNKPLKFVLIRLDPVVHEQLRVYSAKGGISMQKLVEGFILDLIGSNK